MPSWQIVITDFDILESTFFLKVQVVLLKDDWLYKQQVKLHKPGKKQKYLGGFQPIKELSWSPNWTSYTSYTVTSISLWKIFEDNTQTIMFLFLTCLAFQKPSGIMAFSNLQAIFRGYVDFLFTIGRS